MLYELVAFLSYGEAQPAEVVHHRNPDSTRRLVEFTCDGMARRLDLRFDINWNIRVYAAQRGPRNVNPAELDELTRALRALTAIYSIVPQCARQFDLLTVFGRVGNRQVAVYVNWLDNGFWVSEPLPTVFLPVDQGTVR